ncbi:MAG: hypothetical protein K0S33_474 [Bacteroidetes bacterium]|jgi:hypothetical protein|nr:hypothetical protein [Bacteroidota bacterium]
MNISEVRTQSKKKVIVEPLLARDYKRINKNRFWFDWKTEKGNLVYKLMFKDSDEILGLISLIHFADEQRYEINLLAVSKENRGRTKMYDGIAGNLIAYACRLAVKLYAENGCVSLLPKTELRTHYMRKYGMLPAGRQLFLEGLPLLRLLQKYEV